MAQSSCLKIEIGEKVILQITISATGIISNGAIFIMIWANNKLKQELLNADVYD